MTFRRREGAKNPQKTPFSAQFEAGHAVQPLQWQLRGEAGGRQVAGSPTAGFAQVYGAPGTAAATILTT